MKTFKKYLEMIEGQLDDNPAPRSKYRPHNALPLEAADQESINRTELHGVKDRRWREILPAIKDKMALDALQQPLSGIVDLCRTVIYGVGRMTFDRNNFEKDFQSGKINTKDIDIFINQLKQYTIL